MGLKKIAKREANRETQGRCMHFAFLLHRNKIISFSKNNVIKTCSWHTRVGFKEPKIYQHAESLCIKSCPRDIGFNRLTLVVIRLDWEGNLLMSKPCKFCAWLINKVKLKEVIYSSEDGFITYKQ